MRSWRDNYTSQLTRIREVQLPSTVDFRDIGSGQIGSDQIYGQAITEAQLADGSISSAKIGTISADDITTGTLDASAVTVSNLNASNITTGTLSADRISSGSITSAKIASSAITSDKISVSSLSAISANMGTITAGTINGGTINADTISTGTLDAGRIATGSLNGNKLASGTVTTTQLSNVIGADYIQSGTSSTVSKGVLLLGGTSGYVLTYMTVPTNGGSTNAVFDGNGQLGKATSDRRLKEDISPIGSQLNNVLRLKPRRFKWKKGSYDYGFIAQELRRVYPDLTPKDKESGLYTFDMPKLIPFLTMAIQEQQKQIEALTKEVASLKKRGRKWYNIH